MEAKSQIQFLLVFAWFFGMASSQNQCPEGENVSFFCAGRFGTISGALGVRRGAFPTFIRRLLEEK